MGAAGYAAHAAQTTELRYAMTAAKSAMDEAQIVVDTAQGRVIDARDAMSGMHREHADYEASVKGWEGKLRAANLAVCKSRKDLDDYLVDLGDPLPFDLNDDEALKVRQAVHMDLTAKRTYISNEHSDVKEEFAGFDAIYDLALVGQEVILESFHTAVGKLRAAEKRHAEMSDRIEHAQGNDLLTLGHLVLAEGRGLLTGCRAVRGRFAVDARQVDHAYEPGHLATTKPLSDEEMEVEEEMEVKAEVEVEADQYLPHTFDDLHFKYLEYLKSTKFDAKFDDYVESLIDPLKPGHMKWLMEIYPDFVTRRLQTVQTARASENVKRNPRKRSRPSYLEQQQ